MLGKKVKDTITGFTGIATARCHYLNGCIQFKIEAPIDKAGETKFQWFDEGQLKVVGKGISITVKDIGGPAVNMPKGLSHP